MMPRGVASARQEKQQYGLARSRPEPGSRRNTNMVFLFGPGSGCTDDQIEPGSKGWPDNRTAKTCPIQAKSQVWRVTKHTHLVCLQPKIYLRTQTKIVSITIPIAFNRVSIQKIHFGYQERHNLNLGILSPRDSFAESVVFQVLLLEKTKHRYETFYLQR